MFDPTNTERQLINETYAAVRQLVDAVDQLRRVMEAATDLGTVAGITLPQTLEDVQAMLDATATNMPAETVLKLLVVGPAAIQMLHTPQTFYAPDGVTPVHVGTAMQVIRAFANTGT